MDKPENTASGQDPIPGKGDEFPHQPGQDMAWRRVYMGQVADPLVPPHPEPPESPEDELNRAAMEDPGASTRDMTESRPTLWRVVVLIVLAVVALAVVFWRK
jgi:hypothetical protein